MSGSPITVILPVYLREGGHRAVADLTSAIGSVLDQLPDNGSELLIVDDGSVYDLTRVIEPLGSSSLRYIRSERNHGIVSALNRGIVEARTPLIGRIDADDTWAPGKLAAQLNVLESEPDTTIVATGMTIHRTNGDLDQVIRRGDWTGILDYLVTSGSPFPHGSVVGKTEIFRLLGGYSHAPQVQHCEDFALWATWLRFFKPMTIERALYDYVESPSSVSAANRAQQLRATTAIRQNFDKLNVAKILPSLFQQLAQALRCSVLEAGIVAYCLWRFPMALRLPTEAVEILHVILPDRHLMRDLGPATASWKRLDGILAALPLDLPYWRAS